MKTLQYSVRGTVEIFQVQNPWIYVRVPEEYTLQLKKMADRGLVPVSVTLGKSTWDTSLMPMGDGTQFIPLNAKIRRSEGILVGHIIDLSFILRQRQTLPPDD